jgi:hypothetical protein
MSPPAPLRGRRESREDCATPDNAVNQKTPEIRLVINVTELHDRELRALFDNAV